MWKVLCCAYLDEVSLSMNFCSQYIEQPYLKNCVPYPHCYKNWSRHDIFYSRCWATDAKGLSNIENFIIDVEGLFWTSDVKETDVYKNTLDTFFPLSQNFIPLFSQNSLYYLSLLNVFHACLS